jgi:hypothetical protein
MPFMLMHHHNFAHLCAGLAFVTNARLDSSLSSFLKGIGGAAVEADLPSDAQIAFRHIARAYTATDPKLVHRQQISLLRFADLRSIPTSQLENVSAALLELADVIVEFSEIELLQRQAKQIAREIVSRVRTKVAHTTTVVPTSDEYLQRDKGIVIAELLKDLSLSKCGTLGQDLPNLQVADYDRPDGLVGYSWVMRYTRAFLDSYLKRDKEAGAFLKVQPGMNAVPKHTMSINIRPSTPAVENQHSRRE